jgi:hypothetical protein
MIPNGVPDDVDQDSGMKVNTGSATRYWLTVTLDQLVYNTHRIEMRSDSMRKKRGSKPEHE